MASWLIPALKAVLPHVGSIISAATPVFSKRRADAANQALALQEQIAELQSAASQNAAHVKELAEQLQTALAALEDAASMAEARMRHAFVLAVAAAGLSAISLGLALFVIFFR